MQDSVTTKLGESELEAALEKASTLLLSLRNAEGIWTGKLSASALSTATALVALEMMRRHAAGGPELLKCIENGRAWLAAHPNPDGGWGDTVHSKSNISTTTLAWAALGCGPSDTGSNTRLDHSLKQALAGAEKWLSQHAGGLEPGLLATKILERYGSDRTFSAPILTHCALAGRLGIGPEAWRHVIALPFELAACPAEWFGALRLPVVSYALPALIAIGYVRHYHAPSKNPILRMLRRFTTQRVLRVLETIQPSNGGFLEAIPLTSFVVMSLAASDQANHPVAKRGLNFVVNSAQPDGSWKIDTNLATFVTTLAVHALTKEGRDPLPLEERKAIHQWLTSQQYRVRHPYTNAAPGGWAWTPLPGGVPDADDTSGALLALKSLGISNQATTQAAENGVTWLLDLQNRDGGIPTFCRGWGKLPFDRSSADITAHALRAWASWEMEMPRSLNRRIRTAKHRAIAFLARTQESAGSWAPLWFGNQFESDESNRVYGTSRVALALAETGLAKDSLERGLDWLASAQHLDGGWGGGRGAGPSTTEETALALEALSAAAEKNPGLRSKLDPCIRRGLANLMNRLENGTWANPSPIGFYFAKLWYYEELYPLVFTMSALQQAQRYLNSR